MMILDEIVNRAVPIHEKDCHNADGKKCGRDCRLTISYKEALREALKKRIIEYGEQKKKEGFEMAKGEGGEMSKPNWNDVTKYLID